MTTIFLSGSLRNPDVPHVGNELRQAGYDVFDDWHAGGTFADDEWMKYERIRGRTYKEALAGYNAKHIFDYDLEHLNRADVGVLLMPAGKSAHLELGYMLWARQKPGYILCLTDEPDRWDIMVQFATAVCFSVEELLEELRKLRRLDDKIAEQVREYRRAPWSSDR